MKKEQIAEENGVVLIKKKKITFVHPIQCVVNLWRDKSYQKSLIRIVSTFKVFLSKTGNEKKSMVIEWII